MYRKVKDVEQQIQTNLLVEKQDIESIDFRLIRMTGDNLEFRNSIKTNSEQIKATEEQIKDVLDRVDRSDVKNTEEIEMAKSELRTDFKIQDTKLDEMKQECDRTLNNLDLFMDRCQSISKSEVERVITLFKTDTQRIMNLERQSKAFEGIQKNLTHLNSSVSQLIISQNITNENQLFTERIAPLMIHLQVSEGLYSIA